MGRFQAGDAGTTPHRGVFLKGELVNH